MKYISKNIFKNYFELGKFSFYFGLFFLPSAVPISIIFLLFSLVVSFSKDFKTIFKDKINIFFLLSCLFLFFSSLLNFIDKNSINNISNNSSLTFIGLFNWIPLIIAFIGFQKYLLSSIDRKRCIIALISGSIPVIFSCFSQSLLNWYGPMDTLFGLIVWYQRPIDGITGITGLFNNPNYLTAWLNIIWPFCIGLVFFDKKNIYKFIFKFFLIICVSLLIILTASRAGWLCLFLPLFLIHNSKIKKWILSILPFISLIILNLYFPIFGIRFQTLLQEIIPKGIWINFTELEYKYLDISRIGIWKNAMNFISENPMFGHGSRSFTTLFLNATGFWKGHAHNLPLELMVNYGIPATLFVLLPITYLIYIAYFRLYIKNYKFNKYTILDKAWIISLTSLVLMHLVDIQYFDGRISIAGWILIAGTRNIVLNYRKTDDKKSIKYS